MPSGSSTAAPPRTRSSTSTAQPSPGPSTCSGSCYLQAEGYEFPASVVAAQYLRRREVKPGTHLDYGSGVGVTGQLFASLGYETALGDVSTSLLEFARYRLERRGQAATYLDLAARARAGVL